MKRQNCDRFVDAVERLSMTKKPPQSHPVSGAEGIDDLPPSRSSSLRGNAIVVSRLATTRIRIRCIIGWRRGKRGASLPSMIVLGVCAAQASACVAALPRDSVPQQYASAAEVPGYRHNIRIWGDSYASYPAERLVRLRDERVRASKTDPSINMRELNALTLSGGGGSGAFGAGIVVGWAEAGNRPKFDIVTGISAGALIAPFAFLGPAYDDELKEGFTTVTDANIYKKRGLLAALLDGSFASNAPLAKLLDEHVTDRMLDEVAREYSKGRRLFVGTTNLDADRAVFWDMGAIAASGRPDRKQLFKEVILASTSIPGIFPPVYLRVQDLPHQGQGAAVRDPQRPNHA
jgi:hypothetical protein